MRMKMLSVFLVTLLLLSFLGCDTGGGLDQETKEYGITLYLLCGWSASVGAPGTSEIVDGDITTWTFTAFDYSDGGIPGAVVNGTIVNTDDGVTSSYTGTLTFTNDPMIDTISPDYSGPSSGTPTSGFLTINGVDVPIAEVY